MKLLILGSEGFIGSHLVSFFKTKGYIVFTADIVLKNEAGYFLINPEVPDYSFIFSNSKFDACINATGAANVQLSFEHPSLDFTLNTFNVYNFLNAIRVSNPACRFVNISSAAVYGNPTKLPILEEEKISPVSPYGYHKWFSELICSEFYHLYNIPTLSIRIFSAYGEGLKKQLFWDVFQKMLMSERKGDYKIDFYGTGNETRDFIHVYDICRAIELVLANGEFQGGKMNVATGRETTIREAVQTMIQSYNPKFESRFLGSTKVGDPLNWQADISSLNRMGFQPEIGLAKGIANLVTWLKGLK